MTKNVSEKEMIIGKGQSLEDKENTLYERIQLAHSYRQQSKDHSVDLDYFLLNTTLALESNIVNMKGQYEEIKAIHEQLVSEPWFPAVFNEITETAYGPKAIVSTEKEKIVVAIDKKLPIDELKKGDEVYLSVNKNVILSLSSYGMPPCGQLATFDRFTKNGKIILKHRDEEVVIEASQKLLDSNLKTGDLLRYDSDLNMAFEKLERTKGTDMFLEEVPDETFDRVGGLNREIESIKRSILLRYSHREIVDKYLLHKKGSILLVGPPGTGKTMIAKSLANWLGSISRSGKSKFMNIKPAGLHSMWYSQSEANYREVFRIAREAGKKNPDIPVVLFFDEIDAVGHTRGSSITRVDDRVLTAFMAELDGLEARGNIMVVAATNRIDSIDPALLRPGRLGDMIIEIPRPNIEAAKDIFGKYLSEELPYAYEENGDENAEESRKKIINMSVAKIYSPSSLSDIAVIIFRDARKRTIKANDLISGAVIEKITRAVKERACLREIETGKVGIRTNDVMLAIEEEIASMAYSLTPENCGKYIEGLPQEVPVSKVEPLLKKSKQLKPYVSLT